MRQDFGGRMSVLQGGLSPPNHNPNLNRNPNRFSCHELLTTQTSSAMKRTFEHERLDVYREAIAFGVSPAFVAAPSAPPTKNEVWADEGSTPSSVPHYDWVYFWLARNNIKRHYARLSRAQDWIFSCWIGLDKDMVGFRSGQTGQTVNLLATPSKVRILIPPPLTKTACFLGNTRFFLV